jgi:hypothetical protein
MARGPQFDGPGRDPLTPCSTRASGPRRQASPARRRRDHEDNVDLEHAKPSKSRFSPLAGEKLDRGDLIVAEGTFPSSAEQLLEEVLALASAGHLAPPVCERRSKSTAPS